MQSNAYSRLNSYKKKVDTFNDKTFKTHPSAKS